jgi:hypothetical protein
MDELSSFIRGYMRRYHGEESAPETISKLTSLIAGDLGLPIEYPIVIDTLENLGG